MEVYPGDVVWIRSDLRVGDAFPFTSGGINDVWRATRSMCNFAGCKVTVAYVSACSNELFQIVEDLSYRCMWFHVGMIEATNHVLYTDVDQVELLSLIGGDNV